MPGFILTPAGPVVFGIIIAIIVSIYRHRKGLITKVYYLTIFMNAAATYVFIVMLVNHKFYYVQYSEMLEAGFGLEETSIAFIFASYHFCREIYLRATLTP